MAGFSHVFKPIKIGPVRVKNRIEVSPAEPFLCSRDGMITPEIIAFTAQMAKGGAGIVTVGDSPVNEQYAAANRFVVNLSDPYIVHGLVSLTDAIHRYGAAASIELNLRADYLPADLNRQEIRQIIKDFADAAGRCRQGGFDMVMIHGGHGHTVSQFYSPLMNKRTDEYGCDTMENRCRFADELLDAVREKIGPDMAIEYRISGDELMEGGVGIDEALEFARYIQDKIDLIHVSAGSLYDPSTIPYIFQPSYLPMATNLHLARRFKSELNIPVTTVGSFNMALAEEALASGQADVVAMIRAFIADPEQVEKARMGRADEIRPCIRCNRCLSGDPHGCPKPLRCAVNPASGRNPEFDDIRKTDKPKKVVIIGGGCAGMEAARQLARRGHRPVLFEKNNALGGSLIQAGANTMKSDVRRYGEWSVRMTERTEGIDIKLGVEATRELVEKEAPDALIIAVGSEQIVPDVPGIDRENVVLAVDVDMGKAEVGRRVVLVGAGLTGLETAVMLADRGHMVTVIDMLSPEEIVSREKNAGIAYKMALNRGVKIIGGLELTKVGEGCVMAQDQKGKETELPCDSVVVSVGVKPRSEEIEQFMDICLETYIVGDCAPGNKNGNIATAVRDGFFAAMNI
jgi:2,4-dienoyl-CoA reductase-like NADH-dependent reductase (Old Yellow Enzyme family)/thioredoxin reductase